MQIRRAHSRAPLQELAPRFHAVVLVPTLAGEEAIIMRYSSGIEMDAGWRPLVGFREGDQGRRGAWALISAAKRDLRLLRWRL